MNIFGPMRRAGALAVALALVTPGLATPAAAQNISRIDGEVKDVEGKPFADVVVVIKHEEMGQTWEHKTDKDGRFTQAGLRSGVYSLSFKVKGQEVYSTRLRLALGAEERVVIDFKKIIAEQGANVEARKKQEEESKKFESLKAAFDAGVAALNQARQIRGEMPRAPADQRAARQQQAATLNQQAISAFQEAEKAVGEKDSNLTLVLFKLGEAYEAAAQYAEAVTSYERAIALKPTEAGYYNNMGNALAKMGKFDEAMAAYEKSATLDPANAGQAYRNAGIVLFDANKMKESVAPLKKATEIDPNNADGWFLLGRSLANLMESKLVGDKIEAILQPGTVEAYQKYLELAPNGRFAADAKAGLDQLQALGVGIETKIRAKKKK